MKICYRLYLWLCKTPAGLSNCILLDYACLYRDEDAHNFQSKSNLSWIFKNNYYSFNKAFLKVTSQNSVNFYLLESSFLLSDSLEKARHWISFSTSDLTRLNWLFKRISSRKASNSFLLFPASLLIPHTKLLLISYIINYSYYVLHKSRLQLEFINDHWQCITPHNFSCETQEILSVVTTSLLLLPGPLWLGMVIPISVPSRGQIDLFENNFY